MTKEERLNKMINILEQTDKPLSGTTLASMLGVSRQVIVQYISLAKAANLNVIATSRGYYIASLKEYEEEIESIHDDKMLAEELYTIVDFGGICKDVSIIHPIYGKISAKLNLSSRYQVDEFLNKIKDSDYQLLNKLTSGNHYHKILTKDQKTFELINNKLKELNIIK